MYYILRLKNDKHSRADRIQANSLEEAKSFYIGRKLLDEETFDKLYDIELDD